MKWEELPLADRAKLMAAAVRNGYTDIRSIKEAYANFLNQKLSTGNRYAEGGDTDEPEVINLLDNLPVWKALENIDYEVIADPEFTREKTGAGSIEYFSADHPEGITYNNGYHRDHPMPGRDVILYNPNTNDEQDIRLDALHIMPKDPTYDALNSLYREAARDSDVAWAAALRYKEDVAKYGKEALDKANMTSLTYFNNEVDGFLRNMFIEGTPEYIKSRRYYPNKLQLAEWNPHLMPYINRIEQYLKTGERPADILPELIVTNQNAYGGNLFAKGSKINTAKPNYNNIGGVQGFLNLLDKKGIKYIKSSGYRPNAKTKSGNDSWHSKLDQWGNSQAVDLVFSDFEKARKAIYSDPELVAYLMNNKLGLLEETTSGVLAKTGGTGKHFHLGPDRWALQMRDNAIKLIGATYHPMQDVTWQDVQARRKQFELTPEEETLLNTPALATYNPEYVDRTDPNYRSALADVALDESLDAPVNNNNWEKWNAFLNMQSSQSDPLSQMTMMASLSPNTTPLQKEAASTMYQLFAPQDGDYSYHGLNFAAYGGKVNRFDGYGDSHLNAVRSSNPRRDGYYITDGAGTRREITYEQALELAKNNPNLVVNYYKDNVGGTGRLHWDENQNQFVDNNEYFGKELDNVDVVKFVNHPTRQLTDAIPTISTPILEYRSDITPYVDFTNTDQNMFHRRDVVNADAAVREALSSDVIDHAYDYMMPSTWAGAADKLFDHDEDGNLKYNFFTDFNKVFNPAYDNQGFVGLVGADEWADEHPEATAFINTGVDLILPFGIKGTRAAVGLIGNRFNTYRLANEINKSVQQGIRPRWSNNMMYRRALLQEADDLMYSGKYRELPEGKTVPQNLNSEGAISRRLKNRERIRSGNFAIPEMHKSLGNSHGGKSFAKGQPWQGTTSSGATANELILETFGQDIQVGHHGHYTDIMPFGDIKTGSGLWRKFGDNGETGISSQGTTIFRPKLDGTYEMETLTGNEPSHYINYNYLPASEPQVMSFEDVIKPSFELTSNDIHVSANSFNTHNSFTSTKNWQDLFRQYMENPKNTSGNIKQTIPTNNKLYVETNFKTNPDLRLRLSLSSPATLLNNDIGNMTVQEVINTYGPEAEYWKKLYDVAKAHNFEGKYFDVAEKAQGNIATMFSLNPQDPDIIAAINNAKSIYDIPEYKVRFEKFGTLGNVFIEDALNRLNNVKLQGRTDNAVITGQHGVYGGAYAVPDPVSPTVGIRDTDSSNYVKSMLEHEFGHAAHGMRYLPKWMERHNESIRPIPKRISDTPGNKYMNEMDEIVTRAKTAVRYANENRLPGESLNAALERLTKEMDTADPNVPGDFRLLKLFFEENSLINFLLKFVGGVAIPATVAPAVMNSGVNNHALGGPSVSKVTTNPPILQE